MYYHDLHIKIMLKSMWHPVEYVCLSRIKLVLRVIKEILHAFQWAVLHTEMDSKWASRQEGTGSQRHLCVLLAFALCLAGSVPAISLLSVGGASNRDGKSF